MDASYDWAEIYPELVNKIRWAICTSLTTTTRGPFSYSLGQPIATVLAQDVIAIIKGSLKENTIPLTTKKVREAQKATAAKA